MTIKLWNERLIEPFKYIADHKLECAIDEIDDLRAALAEYKAKLIECRSSVAFDMREYNKLIFRKGSAVNDCDTDEAHRLVDLVDYIDGLETP